MATKLKCKHCKTYFPKGEKIVVGGCNVCSKGCKRSYIAGKNKIKKTKEKLKEKNKKETIPYLRKKLDRIFSEFIRKRDSDKEGNITCITCNKVIPWKESHNCHWIGRGNKQYRFDETNCNAGCCGCNTFNQEYHQRMYTIHQIKTLGQEKVDLMIDNTKYIYQESKQEYKDKIDYYTNILNKWS